MFKSLWAKLTNPIYMRGYEMGHATGFDKGQQDGLSHGKRLGEELYQASLQGFREVVRARRSEAPQSSPVNCVTYLINKLESAEQDKDRIASLAWEIIAEHVSAEKLDEVSNRMKRLVAARGPM